MQDFTSLEKTLSQTLIHINSLIKNLSKLQKRGIRFNSEHTAFIKGFLSKKGMRNTDPI
jgi:hypothetical protein